MELEYDTFGSPADPALLLIMGFTAQMTAWEDDFCQLLADGGRFVVRFDNRDCGLSTKLDGQEVDLGAVMAAAFADAPPPPVIHSWWVPQLAVKKDAIPGFVNETWTRVPEPGIYRGQCAELCGKDHGFMPIVVNVLPEAEFDGWLAKRKEEADAEKALMAQTFTMDELMARGESVYNKACASCHQPNGEGVPPAFPALKGSAIAMGPVDGHLDIVVNGKQGTAMAAFGAQLNEVDLAAVITYERNAWGNNMGDMLQPIDVAKFKKANFQTI